MDDLNKPLILDNEYSPKKNKNSDNLSNDEIQKKSFQLLDEEELPLDTEKIIQEAETASGFKKEIAEKNEETIIKDGDVDTKKLKQIKIEQNFKENQTRNVKEIKKKEVTDIKKSNKFFFWKKKIDNKAPNKKDLHSSPDSTTNPDKWDLSEETLERELNELRTKKKSS